MADRKFETYTEGLMQGSAPDLSTLGLRLALIDTGTHDPDSSRTGDQFLSDITAGGILTETDDLANVTIGTVAASTLDADDPTLPDPGGGATGEEVLLYARSTTTTSVAGVDTTADTFTFSGDVTADFPQGTRFEISGSTGNDGSYTVSSTSYDSTADTTTVSVYESIGDGTADGSATHVDASAARLIGVYDSPAELPITLDGADDSITLNGSGIFTL